MHGWVTSCCHHWRSVPLKGLSVACISVGVELRPGEEVLENGSGTVTNEGQRSSQCNPPEEGEHIPDEDEEKVVPEYRHIIAIHAGKLKGGLENWLSDDPNKAGRLNLSEQELENAVKTQGTKTVKFTQRNLLRVYPKGARVDSSNQSFRWMDAWSKWLHLICKDMEAPMDNARNV